MNFRRATAVFLTMASALCLGCSRYSTRDEIATFARAGEPFRVEPARLATNTMSGPYYVDSGDLLQIELTNVIQPLSENPGGNAYRVRVDGTGGITLPLVGSLQVSGKTLTQLEQEICGAYHPQFVLRAPAINVTLIEFEGAPVTVSGAVANPGIYNLRRDQMSVLAAIKEAGGIAQNGASAIRIYRSGEGSDRRKVLLPVDGAGAPFPDTAIGPGDVIEVERQPPRYFTIQGLVMRPGAYPYPPGEQYSLSLAIAFAGGLAKYAPRRAEIHRPTESGGLTTIRVSTEPDVAEDIIIKPGDVISVAPSLGYHVKNFFSEFFRTGFYAGANYDMAP